MAYTPTVWKNGEAPAINAENLNKIEQGIANSAPGGFGLGESSGRTANGFSDITGYGFFRIPTESGFAPDTSTNWGGVYIGANLSYGTLLYARNNALMAVREVSGGEVGPIEWINPPMKLGIEYRTTDRYLGKPVFKYLLNGFEAWRPDGQNDWASAGKAVLFSTEKGGTKNISLEPGRTYIFSATNNVFGGVAIVQTMDATVRAITSLVPLANWKIEAGSGLSVNVTDTDGRYGVTVSAMML